MRQHNQCSQPRHFSSSSPLLLLRWTKTSEKLQKAMLSTYLLFSHLLYPKSMLSISLLFSFEVMHWLPEVLRCKPVSLVKGFISTLKFQQTYVMFQVPTWFFFLGVAISEVKKLQQQSELKEWSGHLEDPQKVVYDSVPNLCADHSSQSKQNL